MCGKPILMWQTNEQGVNFLTIFTHLILEILMCNKKTIKWNILLMVMVFEVAFETIYEIIQLVSILNMFCAYKMIFHIELFFKIYNITNLNVHFHQLLSISLIFAMLLFINVDFKYLSQLFVVYV